MAVEGLTGGGATSLAVARHRRRPPGRPARGMRGRRRSSWAACSILPRAAGADPRRRGLPDHDTRCERTGVEAVIQSGQPAVTPATSRDAANAHARFRRIEPCRLRRCRWLPSLTSVTTSQIHRPRRRRRTDALRRLVREHQLEAADLIQPHLRRPRSPARARDRLDAGRLPPVGGRIRSTARSTGSARSASRRCCCSACPRPRTRSARENFAEDGIVQRALRRLRARHPDLLLLTDVCCCEYTSHGHCGVLRRRRRTTTPRSRSSAAWRSHTRTPAPTSWRRAA